MSGLKSSAFYNSCSDMWTTKGISQIHEKRVKTSYIHIATHFVSAALSFLYAPTAITLLYVCIAIPEVGYICKLSK